MNSKYFIEFLGTFFLVLTIALTGNPIAIGAILIAMVYMGGYISGGHFNPAVTLAVLVRGKIDQKDALKYMGFQIAGAFMAALIYGVITTQKFVPQPSEGVEMYAAYFIEFLFTFALCSVVLNVATSDKVKGNSYYGLAIGLTVMAGATAAGKISGGVFNPAIAVGPMLADITNAKIHFTNILMYVASAMSAAFFAGIVYKVMHGTK